MNLFLISNQIPKPSPPIIIESIIAKLIVISLSKPIKESVNKANPALQKEETA